MKISILTIMASTLLSGCSPASKLYKRAITQYIDDIYEGHIPHYRIVFDSVELLPEMNTKESQFLVNDIIFRFWETKINDNFRIGQFFRDQGVVIQPFELPDDVSTAKYRKRYPLSVRQERLVRYIDKAGSVIDNINVKCRIRLKGTDSDWEYPITAIYELTTDGKVCISHYGDERVYEDAINAFINDIFYGETHPFSIVFKSMEPLEGVTSYDSEGFYYKNSRELDEIKQRELDKITSFFDGIGMPFVKTIPPPDWEELPHTAPISARECDIIIYTQEHPTIKLRRIKCLLVLVGNDLEWEYPIDAVYELTEDGKICFGFGE